MKKIFVSTLALVLLISCCAYGFAEEQKEILFRGIPWGSSIPEYLSAIEKDKISGSTSKIRSIYSWEIKEDNDMDESVLRIEDGGYYVSSYPKNFLVAGVPVSNIYAYFMFTHDADNVYSEVEKASLYKAEYDLEPMDIAETFPILSDKLTGLYGQGKKEHGSQKYLNGFTEHYETITWEGKNNTGVRLYMCYREEDGVKEYRSLSLSYGKTNSVDLFNDLIDAITREQKKEMLTDNNDGL